MSGAGSVIAALAAALGGLSLAGGLIATNRRIDRLERRHMGVIRFLGDHLERGGHVGGGVQPPPADVVEQLGRDDG